jgi:hypothetical protein
MAKKESLANILAKELGYRDVAELKKRISKGGDFAGNVKGRLESGEGFGESFKGGISDKVSDIKEAFSAKGVKKLGKKAYMETFKGNDVFSAYMRGKLNKNLDAESPKEDGEKGGAGGLDLGETNVLLKIIAKNSISLHLMSRDMNVLRQNIVQMTKIWTEKPKDGKKKSGVKEKKNDARTKADAFFLREDEREAKLESERAKFAPKDGKEKSPTPEKKEEVGGGFLDSIISMFTSGLMSGLSAILNPGVILKVLGKVFVIATILASLFQGIMAGWDKWKETGDLWEAIKAGLVAIIDFLTLGLFGKENIEKMFSAVGDFIDPIIDSIKDVINGIKDWIVNNVGIPQISIPVPKILQKLGAPENISVGPYYPFKDNTSSTKDQVTKPAAETRKEEEAKAASEKKAKEQSTSPLAQPSPTMGGDLNVTGGDVTNKFNSLQKSAGEIKDLTAQYMTEKVNLINSGLKPGTPEFEKQDNALLQKYAPLIESKKKEVKSFASESGVKEMAKSFGLNVSDLNVSLKDLGPSPTPAATAAAPATSSAPSVSSSMGGESAGTSPTSSGGGDIAPSSAGMTAPGETATASASGGGGGATPPSTTPTESGAASGATASAAPSDATSPSEDTTPSPMSDSGGALASTSSEVAEAQRMESAADMGSTINAPTTTSNKSSTSGGKSTIAAAWDKTFLEFYAAT